MPDTMTMSTDLATGSRRVFVVLDPDANQSGVRVFDADTDENVTQPCAGRCNNARTNRAAQERWRIVSVVGKWRAKDA